MTALGRKRDQRSMRTPSGQKSRSNESLGLEERIALEAATWKRRQQNPDLTISEARKPEYGSVIERWHQDWKTMSEKRPDKAHENVFSQMHKDAAERYHGLFLNWLGVINAKSPRSSSDFSGAGGFDGRDPFEADKAKRDAAIEAAFKDARRAILESGPLGMMAVETIVIENQPADSLRGDLRQALNNLARLWKMLE